jgi:hypothetical protein
MSPYGGSTISLSVAIFYRGDTMGVSVDTTQDVSGILCFIVVKNQRLGFSARYDNTARSLVYENKIARRHWWNDLGRSSRIPHINSRCMA